MRDLDTVAGVVARGVVAERGLAGGAADGLRARLVAVGVGASLLVGMAFAPISVFAQTSEPAALKADPANGEKMASEVCAACHGADGNSTAPENPKLASQHAKYLEKQLHDFKVKKDAEAAARPNAIMGAFAAGLSEQDILDLSSYYSTQQYKPSAAKEKDLVDLGRDIYRGGIAQKGVPACAGCHGPTGSGIPAEYPRLGGQYAAYTESQLVGFRSGMRANYAPMTDIASRLSDHEIKAVSDYVAGLR